ncbi:cupin domain-containing protein [Agitococcus lubricus]|uniref:50S ribosomal protein L16 3-hydroxylase n=1 Tax=Agitococcus lubricus TaxID=1077255 RepID=A0A2T5IYW4_9GAMM|nr:cupin domain-containing protein [Agitococcus lubricus]PTQ89202.1 50S ribosomal protein L16 3-hydroxylase [Agitococcus lubricus]
MTATNIPLSYLGGLTADEFLRDYWQKKPLLVRNAFPELAMMVGKEDLLELGQEDSIEARIILEKDGKKPWELRKGPFNSKVYKTLPKTHWTILVQAVDHYFPELAIFWQNFSFIPSWRTDDIMISYAPVGGSVGKHFDQYDVFLVQGSGQRRWQLGEFCDKNAALVANTSLRILQDMPVTFDEVLNAGDLLYVPPKLAHYGVAQNECITYSFGFRAPSLSHVLEQLVDTALAHTGSENLYQDKDLQAQTHHAWLNPAHLQQLQTQVLALLNQPTLLTEALAPFLSEAKYDDYEPAGEAMTPITLVKKLESGVVLCRDPASRFVYVGEAGSAHALYINGESVDIDGAESTFIALVADNRQLTWPALQHHLANTANQTWLSQQVEAGYWLLLED